MLDKLDRAQAKRTADRYEWAKDRVARITAIRDFMTDPDVAIDTVVGDMIRFRTRLGAASERAAESMTRFATNLMTLDSGKLVGFAVVTVRGGCKSSTVDIRIRICTNYGTQRDDTNPGIQIEVPGKVRIGTNYNLDAWESRFGKDYEGTVVFTTEELECLVDNVTHILESDNITADAKYEQIKSMLPARLPAVETIETARKYFAHNIAKAIEHCAQEDIDNLSKDV